MHPHPLHFATTAGKEFPIGRKRERPAPIDRTFERVHFPACGHIPDFHRAVMEIVCRTCPAGPSAIGTGQSVAPIEEMQIKGCLRIQRTFVATDDIPEAHDLACADDHHGAMSKVNPRRGDGRAIGSSACFEFANNLVDAVLYPRNISGGNFVCA